MVKKANVIKEDGTVICKADIACGFFEKLMGLMFRKSIPDDYGLIIEHCNQIHMMNMRFPLDIIYLSKDDNVVHIDADIHPGKIGKTVKRASYVIEVNSGICEKYGITPSEHLLIERTGR